MDNNSSTENKQFMNDIENMKDFNGRDLKKLIEDEHIQKVLLKCKKRAKKGKRTCYCGHLTGREQRILNRKHHFILQRGCFLFVGEVYRIVF